MARFRRDLKKVLVLLPAPSEIAADHAALIDQDVELGGKYPSPAIFKRMDLAFKHEREITLKKVRQLLVGIPPDDPLFNPVSLLGTVDLGLRETAHTRTLGWLLDPRKEHGFGSSLLMLFLRLIGVAEPSPADLAAVVVDCEWSPDNSRERIDILIRSRSWLVIVEAKLDAIEGDAQCAKYEQRYRHELRESKNSKFVFLTRDGRKPTTAKSEWKACSFLQVAIAFSKHLAVCKSAPGVPLLRLYLTDILKNLYDIPCGPGLRRPSPDGAALYRLHEYLLGKPIS